MSRRPKLSLVQNRETSKKQALAFDVDRAPAASESSPPPAAPPRSAVEPVQPEQLQADNQQPTQKKGSSGWPQGRLLAKAAIVAVTVALSIYLLRRRVL